LEWQSVMVSYCGVEVQLGVVEYYCIVLRSGGAAWSGRVLGYRIAEWRYSLEWQSVMVSYCGVEVQLGVVEC